MSNIHGFDFLRSEHTLSSDATAFDGPAGVTSVTSSTDPLSPTDTKYAASEDASARRIDRSDLEKQFDVLKFLNDHRSSGCLPPHVIQKSTGVHLNPASPRYESAVADMLAANPKVRLEEVPDPENPTLIQPTYGYQAKFANVVDRTTLLAQINRCVNGVGENDLIDSYSGVKADIQALITAGDVMAIQNPEERQRRVLFPRGEQFLVELDGVVGTGTWSEAMEELEKATEEANKIREIEKQKEAAADAAKDATEKAASDGDASGGAATSSFTDASTADATASSASPTATVAATPACEESRTLTLANAMSRKNEALLRVRRASQRISTDIDPRSQIRRGEAINIGGSWFRVSSAVKNELDLKQQPPRARAPPSVVMMKDLSRKNDADGYTLQFGKGTIPIDHPLPEEARKNLEKAKAARDRLHKVAGSVKGAGGGSRVGVTGGATSQLLSSHASSANPDTLASAFVSSFKSNVGGGGGLAGGRKRPGVGRTGAAGRAMAVSGKLNKAARLGGDTSLASAGDQSDQKKSLAELVQDAKEAATDSSLVYSHARRHGCTKDVREMFLATRDDVPKSDVELYNLMIHHKLIEPGEPMSRPRMKLKGPNLDNDGKPKKRRYYERKNQRITNTHLMGTEIGAVLAEAAERQQQGKTVGDGGM